MGLCCGKTRGVRDKVPGNLRQTYSLKRMKSKKLVGVAQIALDPEARAKEEFPKADRDKNGTLSFDEIKILLKRLNAYIPKKRLKQIFDQVDVNKDGQLNLDEFQHLFALADERPMLQKLYKEADQLVNGHVTPLNLHEFLKATAPDDPISGWKVPSVEECGKIVHSYVRPSTKKGESNVMQFHHFRRLMCDPETNHICDPSKVFSVYQDMDQPLSHYYISSSHNSYLEGSQTRGTSTPNAIKHALELGVRVIELDVWDGRSEPIVNHGHTWCKPTRFKACIEMINQYAFVASSYPVILTIENHCTKRFQQMMAKILSSVLGDKLYRFQSGTVEREKLFRGPDEWTTPRQLIGKIVIRDKPKKLHVKKETDKNRDEDEEEVEEKLSKSRRKSKKKNNNNDEQAANKEAVTIQINSDQSLLNSNAKKKGGLLRTMFARKGGKSKSSLSESNEGDSGRTLGISLDPGTSDKTLNSGPVRDAKNPRGEDHESNHSENGDEDEEEYEFEDPFVDDKDENEGLGDKVAAKLQDKKKEVKMTVAGSFRFAISTVNKLGLISEDEANKKISEWLKEPPPENKTTTSVPQLLELVYIKNVKLRIREDKGKRQSIKPSMDMLSSSTRFTLQDFKTIHFTYPEWRSSSSIGESRMLRLVKKGPRVAGLSTYAKHHLLRCYPAGVRVDSGNYDPCPAWNAGIQVVALNYQTNGKPVWLNQGKFADNGACGWVLKPKPMLEARSCGRDTPEEEAVEEESKRYWDLLPSPDDPRGDRFTITIISAHFLPKPVGQHEEKSEIIDPFVELHVCGYDGDEKEVKTNYVNDNGFNPEFNETFSFTLRHSELDYLLFVVKDKDNFGEDFIAQNCFPINLVRPGYRVVPLRRADSSPIPDAFIFVHIKWERQIVPWT